MYTPTVALKVKASVLTFILLMSSSTHGHF